jgi:hypothetical protein
MTRVASTHSTRIRHHLTDPGSRFLSSHPEVDLVFCTLTHLLCSINPWKAGHFAEIGKRLGKIRAVRLVETPYYLSCELQMRHLVIAHRDCIRPVSHYV